MSTLSYVKRIISNFVKPRRYIALVAACSSVVLTLLVPLLMPKLALADSATCPQPPTNIDHAMLTDAQLDAYGLPHRQAGETLAQWQQIVRDAKHRVCSGTKTNESHQLPNVVHSNLADEKLQNWEGNIAIDWGYTEAVGQWTVPCLTLQLKTSYSSVWVGLDGDINDGSDGHLVQAGTEQDEYQDFFGRFVASYFAWIADVPNDPTQVEAFGVNCGDTMYSDIWQDYNSNGNPIKAHMYVSDWSSGSYWSAYNTSNFSNGSTAEWITERTEVNGKLPLLAHFDTFTFTQCFAIRYGSAAGANELPHNYSTMTNGADNNKELAYPGSMYSDLPQDIGDHFTSNWLADW